MSDAILTTSVTSMAWSNPFDGELSPVRYRRGPRSREVGDEGDYT